MAVMTLESLVLCGVSVLCDGVVVNPRLGTGYTANKQKPTTRLTMRHPSPGYRQGFMPPAAAIEPAVADRGADAEVGGTGRSHWRAGVSVVTCRSTTLETIIPQGWSTRRGGQKPMVKANLCSLQARSALSVREASRVVSSPRKPAVLACAGSQPCQVAKQTWSGVGQACPQADRISTASSRRS